MRAGTTSSPMRKSQAASTARQSSEAPREITPAYSRSSTSADMLVGTRAFEESSASSDLNMGTRDFIGVQENVGSGYRRFGKEGKREREKDRADRETERQRDRERASAGGERLFNGNQTSPCQTLLVFDLPSPVAPLPPFLGSPHVPRHAHRGPPASPCLATPNPAETHLPLASTWPGNRDNPECVFTTAMCLTHDHSAQSPAILLRPSYTR